MRKNIRIDNPVSGPGFTTRNRACRYVKHGQAEWVVHGISIRFVRDPRDHREPTARRDAAVSPYWYERAVNTGIAQAAALANTPVSSPAVLLGLGKRKGASRHTFLATQGLV